MKGYVEAQRFDTMLEDMLAEYPVDIWPREWLRFARTVGATLEIIDSQAKLILLKE